MLRTGHTVDDKMVKYYLFCMIFISIFTVSCTEKNHKNDLTEVVDYESHMGWLHGRCLAIKNSNIPKDSQLAIVQLDNPQIITSATVATKAKGGEKCIPLSKDRRKVNIDSGYSFYLVNSTSDINLGIAVVDHAINIKEYKFDYCTTTEGLLYSLKRLNSKNGEDLWTGYYYLGYESEATCGTKLDKRLQ